MIASRCRSLAIKHVMQQEGIAVPEFAWSHRAVFLEEFVEIRNIVKTAFLCDFLHGIIAAGKHSAN